MSIKKAAIERSSKAEEIIRKHKVEILAKCKSYLDEHLYFFELKNALNEKI